ncbi:MAG: hypothetical protein JO112_18685, partial [Planctomycetes bacterium]|nr:hypothetical protein [Planctomycetota bacterium]
TEAFARSARKDLTYGHLYNDSQKYRGQVVHFRGQVYRIRKYDAPDYIWSQGVHDLYEGWIGDPELYGANPMCIVFTDLPPGLAVAEKFDSPPQVSFDGYFFKKFRYRAADKYEHDVPLLIGHGPVLIQESSQGRSLGRAFTRFFFWAFTAIIVGLILVVGGLTWWYRHGDSRVRSRVNASRLSGLGELGKEAPLFGVQENSPPPEEGGPVDTQ